VLEALQIEMEQALAAEAQAISKLALAEDAFSKLQL
jgi:hypothetical protein